MSAKGIATSQGCRACNGTGLDQLWAAGTASMWRAACGISVRQIGARLHLSPAYICDLEHNRRTWNHELLGRWIEACMRTKVPKP